MLHCQRTYIHTQSHISLTLTEILSTKSFSEDISHLLSMPIWVNNGRTERLTVEGVRYASPRPLAKIACVCRRCGTLRPGKRNVSLVYDLSKVSSQPCHHCLTTTGNTTGPFVEVDLENKTRKRFDTLLQQTRFQENDQACVDSYPGV